MKKSNRKVILLIALIIGISVPLFWILVTFNLTNYSEVPLSILTGTLPEGSTITVNNFMKIWAIWTILGFLTIIPSLILNIFGWLKNGSKRILIASILYLIGFNFPSAVLCFIGYKQLKKEN